MRREHRISLQTRRVGVGSRSREQLRLDDQCAVDSKQVAAVDKHRADHLRDQTPGSSPSACVLTGSWIRKARRGITWGNWSSERLSSAKMRDMPQQMCVCQPKLACSGQRSLFKTHMIADELEGANSNTATTCRPQGNNAQVTSTTRGKVV